MDCCLWIVRSYQDDDSESKDGSSSDCDDSVVDKGMKYSNGNDQLIVYFINNAKFRFELTCKVATNYLYANIEVLDQKEPGTCGPVGVYVSKLCFGSFDVSGVFTLSCSDYYRDGNIYIRTELY